MVDPLIERLEARCLLASDAPNVFAAFDGTIAQSNGTDRINIDLTSGNFNLPNARVVLGFELEAASGSQLDPQAIQLQDSHGNPVPALYTNSSLANNTESLTVSQLSLGNYTVIAGAQKGTAGAFHLAVFLAGDANGDRSANATDLTVIKNIYGSKAGDGKYQVAADSNLDGLISSFDLSPALTNQGDSTNLNPLTTSISLTPAPKTLGNGTLVTNSIQVIVSGVTEPGATVQLSTGSDPNFGEGTTTANSAGQYSFSVTLNQGANPIATRSIDAFGQREVASTQVSLDTTAPTIAVSTPKNGVITNTNVNISGVVTDNLSGVASLTAQVDGGTAFAVSVGSNGSFSFPTSFALNGTNDGSHTVSLVATDVAGNVSGPTNLALTLDTQPPVVTIASPATGTLTNANVTVTGTATDNLSGVATLTASVNGGFVLSVAFDSAGSFSFPISLPLDGTADGDYTVSLVATDVAGNVSSPTNVVFTLDTQPPVVTIASPAAGTFVNTNPTISGTVTDNLSGVATLMAQVDGGPARAVSFDATTGAFTFATSLALDGSADGAHAVSLVATDVAGNTSPTTSVSFTLDTIPPAQPTFALAVADRESGSPLATTNGQVTLVGQTDPNVMVTLVGTGMTAQSTNTGAFQIPGVSLAVGDNPLTVMATDKAGNTNQYQATIHRDPSTGGVDQVIYWNEVQLQAIENDASTPEYASRGLAMVSAAVYDSVNAIDGTPGYYVSLKAPADASAEAAVASAAYTVLCDLYPAQVSNFNSLLATDMAGIADGQSKTDGMSVGQSVANAIIAMRANDGSTNYVDYTPGTAPGDWQPTAPAYMPAENPQWATLKPFAMTSDSQFRPGPPPGTDQPGIRR